MKTYLEAVRAMVEDKFKIGKPGEIRAEMRRLRRKFKPEKEGLAEAKKIVKLVEKKLQDDFILRFTKDFAEEQFENLSDRFDKGVLDAVRRSMKSPDASAEALKQIQRLGTTQERYQRSVLQTAKGGIAQAQKIDDASKAGIKYFRYEGPVGGSRAFCSARVGKIFSLDEIEQMEGQNGLPVLYFGGGWNCRHRWVGVTDLLTVALEHQKWDLPYSKKDIDQDAGDYAPEFGLNKEGYIKEAQEVVKGSKEIYGHSFYGKEYQFDYLGERGNVVVDFKGEIRGYYPYMKGKEGDVFYHTNKERNIWKMLN